VSDATDEFTDDETSVHESNIEKAVDNGLLEGFGNNTFAPGDDIDRDQAATILIRTAEFLFDEGFFHCDEENPNETLNVEPKTDVTLTGVTANPIGGEANTADNRTFTVTGLNNNEEYRITLVLCENITRDADGNAVFSFLDADTEADGNELADASGVEADIIAVNNTPTGQQGADDPASLPSASVSAASRPTSSR